ncbi:MAG: arginase family protein [Actinomycetota bacterium]
MAGVNDPSWPRASAWLLGDHTSPPVATLQIQGAPVRLGSISGGRFDLTPAAVRKAMDRFSTYDGELDVRAIRVRDSGDLDLAKATPAAALDEIAGAVGGSLPHSDAVLLLGGDNSITRAGVRGLGLDLDLIGLVTLDAHHDLRDTKDGLTNGNPVRALLEDGLPGVNVVQIGIQPFANSEAYAEVAAKAGITVMTVEDVRQTGIVKAVSEGLLRLADLDAVYADIDMDVLDRAFAPACPGSRPGGLSPADLQRAARMFGEDPKVRAIDIVEVDPERDVAEATVMTAASLVLAFAAGLARRSG